MIIPYHMLEKETLNSLVEEYVSRDGTDNGYEQDLANRVATVMKQLETEEAVIVFDNESQTANIIPKKALVD